MTSLEDEIKQLKSELYKAIECNSTHRENKSTTENTVKDGKRKDEAKKKKKKKHSAQTQTDQVMKPSVILGNMTTNPCSLDKTAAKEVSTQAGNENVQLLHVTGTSSTDSPPEYSYPEFNRETPLTTNEEISDGSAWWNGKPNLLSDIVTSGHNAIIKTNIKSKVKTPLGPGSPMPINTTREPKTNSTVPPPVITDIPTPIYTTNEQKTNSTVPPTLPGKGHEDNTKISSKKHLQSKDRCLLIHDDFHEDFDTTKFSQRFEIKSYKMALISSVKKELRNILHKDNETESKLIVLHVGYKDLWSGSKVVDLLNDFKQIIYWLIKHSQLKVSVSLIIPGGGQYPRLDSEVMSLNISLSDFITSLRDDDNYKNKVFTASNNRLQEFISKKSLCTWNTANAKQPRQEHLMDQTK